MGVSQSMIDSVLKLCDCINHLHINCQSAICSFDVDTKEHITVDSLPTMSNVDSLASIDENEHMDSFRTLPPPADFPTSNEHNHNKVLTTKQYINLTYFVLGYWSTVSLVVYFSGRANGWEVPTTGAANVAM